MTINNQQSEKLLQLLKALIEEIEEKDIEPHFINYMPATILIEEIEQAN